MSIDEKARAYDNILEKARKWYNANTNAGYRSIFEDIFPELKESEDERIRKEDEDVRKWLISQLEIKSDVNNSRELELMILRSIAWLEKQSKQSSNILWHDVSEEPDEQREIFCEWKGYADSIWHDVAFYHPSNKTFWNGEDQIENVVKWAYIDEMLEEQPQSQIKPKFKASDTIQCVSDETDKRTIASSICTGICETCTLNPCPNWEDINCAAAGR